MWAVVTPYTPGQWARRIWRGLWLGILILVVVLHAGGGWYFSGVLAADAFEVEPGGPSFDVEVVETDGDLVTLKAVESDPDLERPGVYGFETETSFLRIGEIIDTGNGEVTRRFEVVTGSAPSAGDLGDFGNSAYPPDPADTELGIEVVSYDTPLGPMDAWYVAGSRSDWIIHVHGKGASPREALRAMHGLAGAGFHQLAITYRNDAGQPADPSGIYQYGRTEWEDLAGAVAYAEIHGAKRIAIVGYSTGAAITLSYAYKVDTDVIQVLVFDAPNLSMGSTVDYGASQRDLAFGIPLPPTLTATAKFITALRLGINWPLIDYLDRSQLLTEPTLIFHGTDDLTTPIEASRELAEQRSHLVTLVEVEGAAHVGSWNIDPASYELRLLDFINDNLD